ncbi:MAG TPA: LamG-like jellyroll fold domain-containing protein [Candidatus Limnocylindria bacterium]|jgi:hypothetical protein|nr:LamG-like jellyroll fold domain-containing protein [Candidatus Limnocylindria bacterium]
MPPNAFQSLLRWAWVTLALAGTSALAQVYTTTPLFSNQVKPGAPVANASATLASGANYASSSRPIETPGGRFKLDSWTAGMPFSSAPPDYNFGDIITPPPQTDTTQPPTIVTANGAFYMVARKQLVAAQPGPCTVNWKLTDGTTKSITYTFGAVPKTGASRLFWTDNYLTGGVSTNATSLPDNNDYAVSFSGIYAKIHYNSVLPDFDPGDSQDTPAGRSARATKAGTYLDLSAVWIDSNNLLRARNQSGYLIVEYFDTPSFDNSVGYEIVYVSAAHVYKTSLVLGDRLLPTEGADVAAGLQATISKASGYVVQWTASGSHFGNYIFATAVNSDAAQPGGDPSKAQILWQKTGNLGVIWPYEPHWYSITWPGDQSAKLYVFDPSNPGGSPPVNIPTNYTASIVWSEKTDAILKVDSSSSKITAVGEGRALIQYQNNSDVWFVPVRVASRTNGAYVSNQEVFWPVGRPLQPVANQPRIQFDGVGNYLSFYSDLQPGLTTELWIKPNAVTNAQSLLAFLDYPQQATIQAALSLNNGNLKLSVLTSGTSTSTVLTSTNVITAGVWNHVAFTKSSSGQLQLFVNGTPDATATVGTFNSLPVASVSYAQLTVGQGLAINGAVASALSFFAGEIKEVRVWGTAESAGTLRSNMSAQLTGGELGLSHLITPTWQESGTPYSGSGSQSFMVLDLASGTDVAGYGTPNSGGQAAFGLDQRLSFAGANNWAEVPLNWTQADNKSVEFWFFSGSANGWQNLLSVTTSTATNLQVGLVAGHLELAAGGAFTAGTGAIIANSYHHIAVSSSGGACSLYLDGVIQATVTLPGSATSVVGTKLILATSTSKVGSCLQQRFDGQARPNLEDPTFDYTNPSFSKVLSSWDTPQGQGNNYAQRVQGLFVAPSTGDYIFYLSADDDTDLFLGTDSTAASKRLIAQETSWDSYLNWPSAGSPRRSDTANGRIHLTAGNSYYLEMIHHQGGGSDNATVTYSIPSAGESDPTSGAATRITGAVVALPGNTGSVEINDFRVYTTTHSAAQISADIISTPNLGDPDLVRLYNFDQVSPATVSGEAVLQLPDLARGYSATYHGPAALGSTLSSASATEVAGGIVRAGTAYHPGIYATESRILPVNDNASDSLIEVWWNDAFTASYLDQPLNIPSTVTRYRLMDPLAPPALILAGQNFSGYPVPATWQSPSIYYQNDSTAAGYNPNEEHALLIGSSVFALRWDLNQTNTSRGFVLLQYKDENRGGLSYLQPIAVAPTNSVYPTFDSTLLVGQLLQPPRPMTDLPKSSLSGPLSGADPLHRLYQDRQYSWWAKSAAAIGQPADSVPTRWYYPLQPGFYWPSSLGSKNAGDPVPFGNTSNGLAVNYTIRWPDVVPTLALGQTLSDAMPSANGNGDLPAVTGQKSVEILFDEANYSSKTSAIIMDPSTISSATLNNLNGINTATDVQLGKTYFTQLPPHLRDRVYWDPIALTLTLTGEIVRPVTDFPYVLPAWLGATAGSTNTDFYALSSLSSAASWQTAVGALRRSAIIISNAEMPFTALVMTPSGFAGGHVTLGMNTRQALNNTGDPVSLYPIFVDTTVLFTGRIIVMYSDNKFDQYTTLRHSGDFGGDPSQYQFEWRVSDPMNGQAPTSDPSTWIQYFPPTAGVNRVIFGGPGLQTLKDQYFSCRWKCVAAGAPNTNWSGWTSPALVESWLTRALDGINPFDQRVESLANNHLDLKTSILSQAGKRFVGAIPLNMDNADSFGLIETYETLLQQARNLSIDAGYSDDDVNQSLLDSASKLNELYGMLGDEALQDAKDPTIAWGSRDLNDVFFGSRASSLFAFQGIVPTLLEEELALLRGLDDTTSTPVTTYPVYNRLYWNFTKGINSGEPAYALNYGIPSVVSNVNGSITEADAAQLYPQGHGDAYGHYLTAVMEYYRLLVNTNFTWIPRAEVKTIGGVNVTFDYVDERKMANSALQVARTADEIVDRTFRRDYKTDPTQHGPLFADSNNARAWSATEWCERASQGVLYNWVILNSLLPGPTSYDTPQTISRATVPELGQLAGMMNTFQDKQDDIDRGDSPMGVDADVVPFDLDPALVDAGQSHFEQVYSRAVAAVQSAYLVLQRASVAAANLRRQDVSLETFRYQINQREMEFNEKLIDLYGTPYPDDIGPTGAYVTGYDGADLYHYNYIDRDVFNPADAGAVTNVSFYAQYSITGDSMDTLTPLGTSVSYTVNSVGIPVLPDAWNGQRAVYGKIQGSLGDYIRSWISLRGAIAHLGDHKNQLEARLQRLRDHNSYSDYYGAINDDLTQQKLIVDLLQQGLDATLSTLDTADAEVQSAYQASKDPLPASFIAGLADGGDLSFPARIGLSITKLIGDEAIGAAKDAANFASYAAGKLSEQLDGQISDNNDALAGAEEQSQTVMESTVLLSQLNADRDSVYGAAVTLRQAWQSYISLVAKGNQLQTDLLVFREANAARIQEARYADVIFRTFKNEDLEQYLAAFQQASRYVFAAARVYDYETGLLDPNVVSGQDGDFIGETMKATQLGDMVDGHPLLGSTSANSLASILARMSANWSVLEGRFGINNPTRETHKVSLRQELFRIGHSTNAVTEANNLTAWQNKLYTYRVADIRQVPEFKNFCQLYSPMGTNEPALVIPFSTEITSGKNIFGLPLAGGDSVFDSAHFTTKFRGAAITLAGYNTNVGSVLTKSPRAYLVPVGIDRQRTPMSGGASIRDWRVIDQVWPIPFPSAAGNVELQLTSIGTDNVHTIRRFPPMRAYDDDQVSALPAIPYDGRLIGRSVWNTQWVLIIPGSSLSSSSSSALDSLIGGISDIYLALQTYSYSGN